MGIHPIFISIFIYSSWKLPKFQYNDSISWLLEVCPRHDVDTISTISMVSFRYRIDIDNPLFLANIVVHIYKTYVDLIHDNHDKQLRIFTLCRYRRYRQSRFDIVSISCNYHFRLIMSISSISTMKMRYQFDIDKPSISINHVDIVDIDNHDSISIRHR